MVTRVWQSQVITVHAQLVKLWIGWGENLKIWIELSFFSNLQYKILLYASKQQQVTIAKIHSNFSFTVSNYFA